MIERRSFAIVREMIITSLVVVLVDKLHMRQPDLQCQRTIFHSVSSPHSAAMVLKISL